MQAVLGFLRIFDIKYVLFIFFQIKIENWYNLGSMFILENCMHEFGGGGRGRGPDPLPLENSNLLNLRRKWNDPF